MSDHLAIREAENVVSDREPSWYAFHDAATKLMGHDIDGDQAEDGYSLDGFYKLWERGLTPDQAVQQIRDL
jgi:hypothetical protein